MSAFPVCDLCKYVLYFLRATFLASCIKAYPSGYANASFTEMSGSYPDDNPIRWYQLLQPILTIAVSPLVKPAASAINRLMILK